MTRLFNNAAAFAEELLDGFAMANPGRVRRVEGGVVRAVGGAPGTVVTMSDL
jgi:D-erythrulose 4-kinase